MHILITGASSGIGKALAMHWARSGCGLSLTGRDPQRLEATAEACRERGAEVTTSSLDVRDRDAVERWVLERDDAAPSDRVVANTGISGGGGSARDILAVNVLGVANTVEPLLPRMVARGVGQVALMGSLAAFRAMPTGPAYAASKAAVMHYGAALRLRLRPSGVAVSVICPGFVETPLTRANRFPMPLLMTADKAALIIAQGLDRRRGLIAFPWPMVLAARASRLVPDRLVGRLTRRWPAKT